jgi:2-polyprenyl-3-methyl-5-hydroxy-6-metoxy-1,4-benzoquinol methylase
VGCADGALLRELAARGREVAGCELHRGNVERLRQWLPAERVYDRPLADIPGAARFAAVCLFDVLEHLPRPKEELAHVRRLLAPGGRLVIKVPNGGFQRLWRRMGRQPGCYMLDQHVHVFTRARLAALLTECGFEVVAVPFWFRIRPAWETGGRAGDLLERVRWLASQAAPGKLWLPNDLAVIARAK